MPVEGGFIYSLSLHAPSRLVLINNEELYVCGYMDLSGGSGEPVKVLVDNVDIGEIKAKGSMTDKVKLEPGEHTLSFAIDEKHKGMAHTVWLFSRII